MRGRFVSTVAVAAGTVLPDDPDSRAGAGSRDEHDTGSSAAPMTKTRSQKPIMRVL